jgi:PAS domain S-box-containing protein
VLAVSVVLQLLATFWALKLIPITGKRTAWVLIVLAIFFMLFRRGFDFYYLLHGYNILPQELHDILTETVSLLTSFLLALGIVLIAPLFKSIRESERSVKESEERLLLAKKAGRTGVYDLNLKTETIMLDERMREIWGIVSEDVTYEAFISGIHPDDRELRKEALDKAMHSGSDGRYSTEYRVITKTDKKEHWVAATGQVFFERGLAARIVGIVRDVTEDKRREAELKKLTDDLERSNEGTPAVRTRRCP